MVSTSCSAAPAVEVTTPIARGNAGSGRLRAGVEQALGLELAPSAAGTARTARRRRAAHRLDHELQLAARLVDARGGRAPRPAGRRAARSRAARRRGGTSRSAAPLRAVGVLQREVAVAAGGAGEARELAAHRARTEARLQRVGIAASSSAATPSARRRRRRSGHRGTARSDELHSAPSGGTRRRPGRHDACKSLICKIFHAQICSNDRRALSAGRPRARLPTKLSTEAVDCSRASRICRAIAMRRRAQCGALTGASSAIIAPLSRLAAPLHPPPRSTLVFDHTSRRLADLAADPLFDRRPGPGDRALRQPAHAARRAAQAARRSDLGHARTACPAPDVVNKLADNSVLGAVLASGLRAVIADPRITEDGLRAGVRDRRPRRGAPAGALPQHAGHHRLGGAAAGPAGHRDRHDRDLRLAGARPAARNPAQLAHGISVALYNTAFGLIIAIPALMFYRYFRGRVDEYMLDMEQAAERMVPHLMRFAVRARRCTRRRPAA